MNRWNLALAGICALLLIVAITCWFSLCGVISSSVGDGASHNDADYVPTVKAISEPDDAVREARRVDLPLLEEANKVIIELTEVGGGPRSIILRKSADIEQLR